MAAQDNVLRVGLTTRFSGEMDRRVRLYFLPGQSLDVALRRLGVDLFVAKEIAGLGGGGL